MLTLCILPIDLCAPVNTTLFASPIGWAAGLGVTLLLCVVEREWGEKRPIRFLRSARMARWLLGVTALCCVLGGSIPAWAAFYNTWPFVMLLALLLVHLALVVIHRMRRATWRRDGGFILTHGGLWLALFSGLVGAADTHEMKAVVDVHQETNFALESKRARMVPLGYSLRLKEFRTETNKADGSPVQYEATIWVDGTARTVAVNHPCPVRWNEDLYLLNFETNPENGQTNSCLLLIVRQPWKHITLTGIIMLMAGTAWMLTGRKRKEAKV